MKEMIQSSLIHAIVALGIQGAVGLLTGGDWLAGGIAGALFFLGREVAQREYHLAGWRQGKHGISIKELKPWAGFDILKWNLDEKLDIGLPILAVAAVYLVERFVV